MEVVTGASHPIKHGEKCPVLPVSAAGPRSPTRPRVRSTDQPGCRGLANLDPCNILQLVPLKRDNFKYGKHEENIKSDEKCAGI